MYESIYDGDEKLMYATGDEEKHSVEQTFSYSVHTNSKDMSMNRLKIAYTGASSILGSTKLSGGAVLFMAH